MALLLYVDGVSKKYEGNETYSLTNFTLRLNRGTTLALMGESGSGKTTLLKLIAGIEDKSSGEIFFKNKKILGPKEKLVAGMSNIRLINQNLTLPPNESISSSIAYQLRHFSNSFKTFRTQELLMLFQLEAYSDKRPHELSGGQRQRALFAWAIADVPDLLLMDEPLSHLDDLFKNYLYESVFKILKKTKTTVIFATHQANEVFRLADEVILIKNGSAIQQGRPEDVYKHPSSEHSALLMGTCGVYPLRKFSKLFPSTLNRLNISNSEKIITRPFEWEWSLVTEPHDCMGEVLQVLFMSGYYEVKVKISKNEQTTYRPIIVFYTHRKPENVENLIGIIWKG